MIGDILNEIVLKKDGKFYPVKEFSVAKEMLSEGYEVHINKTGKVLKAKAVKKEKAK